MAKPWPANQAGTSTLSISWEKVQGFIADMR